MNTQCNPQDGPSQSVLAPNFTPATSQALSEGRSRCCSGPPPPFPQEAGSRCRGREGEHKATIIFFLLGNGVELLGGLHFVPELGKVAEMSQIVLYLLGQGMLHGPSCGVGVAKQR